MSGEAPGSGRAPDAPPPSRRPGDLPPPSRRSGDLPPPSRRDVAGSQTPLARVVELLDSDPRFADLTLTRPHPLVVLVRRLPWSVLIAPAEVWDKGRDLLRPFASKLAAGEATLLLVGRPQARDLAEAAGRGVCALLPDDVRPDELSLALANAFDLLATRDRAERQGRSLDRHRFELNELIDIARAMATEREPDKLLGLILEKSRFITNADAGSIYVVEGDDPDPSRRLLRFKLSQNDSVRFDAGEFTVPINPRSIAGAAALARKMVNIADVEDLPEGAGYGFDRRFDEKVGYRTRSMLTAPLFDRAGEVIGVLQLINKKRDQRARLHSPEDVDAQVVPFDERSEKLLATLAAQAGISLENALLYAEIRSLFEGFVSASVEAIEQRDPTTSGHSRRVADLTLGLARAIELESGGPYRDVYFTAEDLRELEYASLLHDFGKIGVREEVLVKAKKLYPAQLAAVRQRFDLAARTLECRALEKKLALVREGAPPGEVSAVDDELAEGRARLEAAFQAVSSANEPTVLSEGDFAVLGALARETFVGLDGSPLPLLTADEVESLSVRRGSLTKGEFDQIQGHVRHTRRFLEAIPWGRGFRRVPVIAGSHHERLDGTGYPFGLRAEQIPLQAKMMSISDIFDALTAKDRPYKRAVPVERALDILRAEVDAHHVDGELVRIFRESRPWQGVLK
ncbi:MAG TPA: HD domain-containing phosphohydrolase [Polyangiaceae bacterium]|nr:HD domain-containing phosphohydrolase [Polyangiaceae bacterium]